MTDVTRPAAPARASPHDWPIGEVVDMADHGIVVLDSGGRVVCWNGWMVSHSGIAEAAALGHTLPGLFGFAFGRRISLAVEDCLRHGHAHLLSPSLNRAPFPLSAPAESGNGRTTIEQTVTIKPVKAADGSRYGLIQITDVSLAARRERFLRRQTTELALLVAELRAARDVADRANIAKSEFLTGMSHELRSPLNAIIGFSQLLQLPEAGTLNEEQREFVSYIHKAGDHLIRMVNDILDLSKIEAKRLSLDVDDIEVDRFLLDRINGVKGLSLGRGIEVRYVPAGNGSIRIRADSTRLAQIVINLLSNAIKYNRTSGSVTVAIGTADSGRVRISVTDTGPGIPFDRQPELFQSFHRLGAEFGEVEGAGIGLALSRNLAEAMGGTMGFDSRPGFGSTFWVDMPASPRADCTPLPRGTAATTGEAPVRRLALPPFTLLYVEDNPIDRRLLEALFRSIPTGRLITVRSAVDALLSVRAQPVDIVLLDIYLPDGNGFEVLERLRADGATASIPVVAISASALAADIARGAAAGFHHWMTKPLDITELLDVLADLLKPKAAAGTATGTPPGIKESEF